MVPISPVWNQPSLNMRLLVSGSLKYSLAIQGPRTQISPMSLPFIAATLPSGVMIFTWSPATGMPAVALILIFSSTGRPSMEPFRRDMVTMGEHSVEP